MIITITEKTINRRTKNKWYPDNLNNINKKKYYWNAHIDIVRVKTIWFLFIPIFKQVKLIKSGL